MPETKTTDAFNATDDCPGGVPEMHLADRKMNVGFDTGRVHEKCAQIDGICQLQRSSRQGERLYVSFPLALAAPIMMEPGEEVQCKPLDRGELHLVHEHVHEPDGTVKKGRELKLK
jgi:hypothetical protein